MLSPTRFVLCSVILMAPLPAASARPRELALRHVALDLPGPPAVIVSADLNRDGRRDLLIVDAYTRWGSIATDRVEDAIEVTQVVPALFDVREARAFLAQPGGGYRQAGPPLKLPQDVLSTEAGPEAHPVIAVTDEGLSELVLRGDPGSESLDLTQLLAEPSAFADTGAMLAQLNVLKDVDGDGVLDAVLPTPDGIAVHRGENGSFATTASFRAKLPGDERSGALGAAKRVVPIPRVEDVDGDGQMDLVVDGAGEDGPYVAIARGLGGARFALPRIIALGCLFQKTGVAKAAWTGDLEGRGHLAIVTREDVDTGKSDLKQAKNPTKRYRVYRLRPNLSVETEPYTTFEAQGWAFTGAFLDGVDLQFIDLDGDRRKDLVTVTLDFSMFQILRALTAKKVSVGLLFHVLRQQDDGSFKLVPDQKLDETLHFDLNRLEISRLGQFQGDFDGDGRMDFVHLGKGKTVTIHRGEPGARYPDKPDLTLTLEDEPEDVLLVRVRDLDGDGRSDIAITHTLETTEAGATPAVRLELELSGEGR